MLRVGERDLGELRPKDVRIKVAYSALNRADLLNPVPKLPLLND